MPIRRLTDTLYIAPQLTEADAQEAARLGIKSVICNRPDGEEDGQPSYAQVQLWLIDAGIGEIAHQPINAAPAISAADINNFQVLLTSSEAPVLAYCRTGTRSSLLWAYHAVQNGTSVDDAVRAAAAAGVDLSAFAERLNRAAQNGL